MSIADVYFITASLFFGIASIYLVIIAFGSVKILRNFQKASSNFKDITFSLKERVDWISGIVAGLVGLMEKAAKKYSQKRKTKTKKGQEE